MKKPSVTVMDKISTCQHEMSLVCKIYYLFMQHNTRLAAKTHLLYSVHAIRC